MHQILGRLEAEPVLHLQARHLGRHDGVEDWTAGLRAVNRADHLVQSPMEPLGVDYRQEPLEQLAWSGWLVPVIVNASETRLSRRAMPPCAATDARAQAGRICASSCRNGTGRSNTVPLAMQQPISCANETGARIRHRSSPEGSTSRQCVRCGTSWL